MEVERANMKTKKKEEIKNLNGQRQDMSKAFQKMLAVYTEIF